MIRPTPVQWESETSLLGTVLIAYLKDSVGYYDCFKPRCYSYEILLENLMDPAHVNYAHYGLLRVQRRSNSPKRYVFTRVKEKLNAMVRHLLLILVISRTLFLMFTMAFPGMLAFCHHQRSRGRGTSGYDGGET